MVFGFVSASDPPTLAAGSKEVGGCSAPIAALVSNISASTLRSMSFRPPAHPRGTQNSNAQYNFIVFEILSP